MVQSGNENRIVLASASPRRDQLLRTLGIEARIMPSDADESFDSNATPSEIAIELAVRKALAVGDTLRLRGEPGIVIGADTIVVQGGRILGKPDNPEHALAMLTELQGTWHEVYTGVAVIDVPSGKSATGVRTTRVHMKSCSNEQLARYIATGEPADKAGAYAIQGLGAALVESIEGCYTNVVGLPLSLLGDMLTQFGVRIL